MLEDSSVYLLYELKIENIIPSFVNPHQTSALEKISYVAKAMDSGRYVECISYMG